MQRTHSQIAKPNGWLPRHKVGMTYLPIGRALPYLQEGYIDNRREGFEIRTSQDSKNIELEKFGGHVHIPMSDIIQISKT